MCDTVRHKPSLAYLNPSQTHTPTWRACAAKKFAVSELSETLSSSARALSLTLTRADWRSNSSARTTPASQMISSVLTLLSDASAAACNSISSPCTCSATRVSERRADGWTSRGEEEAAEGKREGG